MTQDIHKKKHTKTHKKSHKLPHKKTRKNIPHLDFYNDVNKHWIQHHRHIPKSRNETNPFILLQNKVNLQVKNTIVKKINREKTKEAIRIKNIYDSMLHTSDEQIESHITSSVSTLNYLREKGDMYPFFAWFIQSGFPLLFSWSVGIDEKDPTQYISYIQESGLSFTSKSAYLDKERKRTYLHFLDSMFSLVFGKTHSYNVEKIYEIEKEVAHFLYNDDVVRNFDLLYNVYNEKTIQSECDLDCDAFFESLFSLFYKERKAKDIIINNKIVVENPHYLKHVMRLLKKNWSSEDWNHYWVCQILFTASKFHGKLYDLNCAFFLKKIQGPSPRNHNLLKPTRAVYMVEKIMKTAINKKYLEYYKNADEIAYTKKLATRLKDVLVDRLKTNQWLSTGTIEKVVHKLNRMRFVIGYNPDFQPDPTDCEFVADDSFANYDKYAEWHLNQEIAKLVHRRVPTTGLRSVDPNCFEVNAFYNNNRNEVFIPNAILQPPFVNLEKSAAYNYANIGTIIAHEMIHALDNDGVNYDAEGVRDNHWFKEKRKYKEKQQAIEKLYQQEAKQDGETVRPRITMGENIADICGFLVTEQAFMEKNPSANSLREFYRCYGEKWKTIMKPKWLHESYKYDIHSLSKYRVNCVLSFSDKFNELFNGEKTRPGMESPF